MDEARPVEIPIERLDDDLLTAVIDDFVLREGTDYGHEDISLETKRRQIRAQLRAGTAALMFDPGTESCTIVVREAPGRRPLAGSRDGEQTEPEE